ncbi:MAG: lysoplasmalogenase [Thermoflexales bacterium]
MPIAFALIPPFVITLLLLLRAEALQPRRPAHVRVWKSMVTAWLLGVAWLSLLESPRAPLYTVLVSAGLACSLVGDWLLIEAEDPKRFARGGAALMLAHMSYVLAFAFAQHVRQMPLDLSRESWLAVALLVMGGMVYLYLRPSVGAMNNAVLLYITTLSLMVHRAASSVVPGGGLIAQPALAAGGALLCYASDFMMAINKFVFGSGDRSNHVWVLVTRYSAQLLIALSASLL